MAYRGVIASIPLGQLGLETDVNQILEPPFSLQLATNVSLRYGRVEKDPGSARWNQTVFPAGIAGFSDWWPDGNSQRVIVMCKDGKVYRHADAYTRAEVLPTGSASAVLNPSSQTQFVAGGAEQQGNSRKLFLFSGNDPIQVIKGDSTTRTVISKPAADWVTGNYPTAGIVFNSGLWVWGCKSNPHTLYRSSTTDHEDFQTIGATKLFSVFPGEFDGISCCFAYKTRLFQVKFPKGLYYVDDSNGGTFKLSDSFGAASAHAAINVLDDMLIANSSGSISSLKAVQALGNTEQGDVLKMLKSVTYMQENMAPAGIVSRQAIYYEDKKQALFTYRSSSGFKNDRILRIDYHDQTPRVTWADKDQPNCLGLIRDYRFVDRPFYGAEDGYLYQMDHPMRNVGGAAYQATLQTPELDFRWLDPKLEEAQKNFDFLAVSYESVGKWNLSADVFVDGRFVKTLTFSMSRGTYLDGAFKLDKAKTAPRTSFSQLKPVEALGKRISIRFYQSGLNQNFKVTGVTFYFRPGGENNK